MLWAWLRTFILFAVGVMIVVDATVVEPGVNTLELVMGLVVLGIVPLDFFSNMYMRK